ncbi:MAG: phospholipase, partial [Kribbellaceae bacterium]|nr:phospholipase [Kribbellaceae bacterium]
LRRFTGNATTAGKYLSATASYAAAPDTGKLAIFFKLTNTSTTAVTFTIRANNYRTDGPWTYQIPAGGSVTDYFNAAAYASGWYDFTITVNSDPTWTQRFTGHLETNTPSVSG